MNIPFLEMEHPGPRRYVKNALKYLLESGTAIRPSGAAGAAARSPPLLPFPPTNILGIACELDLPVLNAHQDGNL